MPCLLNQPVWVRFAGLNSARKDLQGYVPVSFSWPNYSFTGLLFPCLDVLHTPCGTSTWCVRKQSFPSKRQFLKKVELSLCDDVPNLIVLSVITQKKLN